ncbi:MAG: Crp/Fnr family transcriptional regulator [Chroococcales cyanobacterium]
MLLTHKPLTRISLDQYEERRIHLYEKGDKIPVTTQGVWQVCRGLVQLSTFHSTGEEILLGWAPPETAFGTWHTTLSGYQAKAVSDVYLKWYSLSEIERSPNLGRILLGQLGQRMRQTEAILAIAGLKRVEDRLQQLLFLLKTELGQPVPGGTRLIARFTHQTLANAIGTTRVTMTRLLGKLQREGYITLDSDRHLIIQDSFFKDLAIS